MKIKGSPRIQETLAKIQRESQSMTDTGWKIQEEREQQSPKTHEIGVKIQVKIKQ